MPTQVDGLTAGKPRILVADDSRVIRKAVDNILSAEFDLKEAEDGEAAWEQIARDGQIEVLVTDIEMPRLDGYALICRARASEERRIRDLPIIVITGAQDDLTRERAFACGATDFIIKPLDSVQLLARTRAHARLDQATRKLGETVTALEEQGAIDPLTQLNSRLCLLQRGEQVLAYAKRHGGDLSVIRIDVDDFKNLLHRHGEAIGDRVLVWVADAITTTLRTEDSAARLHGGEYAIVTPAAGRTDAALLCERLRTAVSAAPFAHGGESIPVTISLGLASLGRDGDTIHSLLASADSHVTLAKASGGDRLGVGYEEEIPRPEEEVMEQPDMETALKMLERGDGGKLVPYLTDLVTRMIPLLELGDRNLDLKLGLALDMIKKRLANLK
ncbi:MAG: hypothetical protein A2151_03830 [Candidatus Muproteobacteria bacterium RBG_16_65_34]|uniref:diguanylate cyclase n=1 Tax=Candidatus Muproteobacteria bacterium RBG_16_65_34 TaxID=1817760 RepID=A0A1F6TVU3_9PROT|nr:MAG: hypothetical protein A2151_03830 [Candidatus Muproteobacteria bacterium RBG_16_65_34]